MFHPKFIVLTVGISLCLIQCTISSEVTPIKCPENEKFALCKWKNVATCETKRASGGWECRGRGQCICAQDWLVRNEEGVCVLVWECPDICPENAEFVGCDFSGQPSNADRTIMAEGAFERCKPICFCKPGYRWNLAKMECTSETLLEMESTTRVLPKFVAIKG